MAKGGVLYLSESEARATDGFLCWKPQYPMRRFRKQGLACSRLRYHGLRETCRFDMDIRLDPMKRGRLLAIVLPIVAGQLLLGMLLGYLYAHVA